MRKRERSKNKGGERGNKKEKGPNNKIRQNGFSCENSTVNNIALAVSSRGSNRRARDPVIDGQGRYRDTNSSKLVLLKAAFTATRNATTSYGAGRSPGIPSSQACRCSSCNRKSRPWVPVARSRSRSWCTSL
jgi:hypothetical protein